MCEFWHKSFISSNTLNDKTDKQNKLTKKLEKKIKKVSSLEQAVKEFFVVVAEASPNDEEMLLAIPKITKDNIKSLFQKFSNKK